MEIVAYVSLITDVIVGLSVLSASIFACLSLSTWKKELKGKSEYQLAKDLLKSVYRVNQAFRYVRNIIIYQHEYPKEIQFSHQNINSEDQRKVILHVYKQRWEVMEKAFHQLEEYCLDAQVEWGEKFQDQIEKLRECRTTLLDAIQSAFEKDSSALEAYYTQRNIFRDRGKCSEKFNNEINNAIAEFEKELRPLIKKFE